MSRAALNFILSLFALATLLGIAACCTDSKPLAVCMVVVYTALLGLAIRIAHRGRM